MYRTTSEKNPSRRTVLKTFGAGSATVTGLSSVVSAEAPYRGIAYDTLTQKPAGTVGSDIERVGDSLDGWLRIAGFEIPLDRTEQVSDNPTPAFAGSFDDPRFVRDEVPLRLEVREITEPNHHYAGTLSRPSSKFGMLGWYLTDEPGYNPRKALRLRNPDNKWTRSPHAFEIPATGLPTDTGGDRLLELAERDAAEGGDGR